MATIARGFRGALEDPRGVARVVREGRTWTSALAAGWQAFAPLVG